MPRAIWSGSLSFGLISLPVKAYSATERQRIDFDMLHDEDGAKIEYRRVCSVHDEVVPWEHIVKGYEVSPGRYVTFTREELDALQPASTKTIDIEDFVRLDEIDPMYFDTPYHLVPEAGARRAYDLLHAVMSEAGVVAIARVVLRSRERLVAVRPLEGGALAMETLHFANELRPAPQLEEPPRAAAEPSERELKMARSLVDALTVEFDPTKYHDTWREQLLERIEQKAAGATIEVPEPDREATPMTDIVAALERSLAAAREARGGTSSGSSRGNGSATRGNSSSTKKTAKAPAKGRSKAGSRK